MYIPEIVGCKISKTKMRIYLSANDWDIDKVIKKFKNDEWFYSWPFCKD